MHIGLIGGIGPAATDFYYRRLIALHAASGHALDLTMAHADVRVLGANVAAGAPGTQAGIFLGLIRRLQQAGAEIAAVTSLTGHFCIREVEAESPLPLVSAFPAVDAAVSRLGTAVIGLLGTRVVMQSGLYGAVRSAAVIVPQGAQFDAVHDAYMAMATSGEATAAQREALFRAGRDLCARGAGCVVLGGTDMFLAFDGHDCGFPTLDCAQAHAAAIHRAAIGGALTT